MKTALLYLSLATFGYIIAIPSRKMKDRFAFLGTLFTVLVSVIICLMGVRIGSDKEIADSIGTIGIMSFLMAVSGMAVSVFFISLVRRIMGYDFFGEKTGKTAKSGEYAINSREGNPENEENGIAEKSKATESDTAGNRSAADDKDKRPKLKISRSTIIYTFALIAGFAVGYFAVIQLKLLDYEEVNDMAGSIVNAALLVTMVMVGFDMGLSGNIFASFRDSGILMIVIPVVQAAATILTLAAFSIFLPLTITETTAIACSFGWYSLAPGLMMTAGHITAGAYCFLACFMRDVLSVIVIPTVASAVGYLECIPLPQASAIDMSLATIKVSTNSKTAMIGFSQGILLMISVPVLVPLIIGM